MTAAQPIRMPLAIKRGSKRARLMLPATLLTATGQLEIRVRDLSNAGALAEAPKAPAEGSDVVVAFGGAALPATVAWVVGRRFGLLFQIVLSDEEVAAYAAARRSA
jgi:PilZ domain